MPICDRGVKNLRVQRAIIFIALIFAMLAATLHPASAAHPVAPTDLASVHAHDHDHGAQPDSDDPDGESEDTLAHHHCPAAWVPDATPRIEPMPCIDAVRVAARYGELPSRSDDPLLEPPSA